ncbi:MAG: GNAT family N-acetyltransferase [Candidatus Omnitrophota bacterium]
MDKRKALALIIEAIENIARQKGLSIVIVRDFYDHELDFFGCIEDYNYKRVKNFPNTVLKIKWKTFDEYLGSLKSHYRCKIRKNMAGAERKGMETEIISDLSFSSSTVQKLWQNVYDQAKDYKREFLREDFFSNMHKYLKEKARMILFRKESVLRGFALVLLDDDTLRYMFTGLDYDYNKDLGVYLNSLYSVIKMAIDEGKKDVDMGITAYFPKTDVGAKVVNMNVYMKHFNTVLNPLMAFAFTKMTPVFNYDSKTVFKGEAE